MPPILVVEPDQDLRAHLRTALEAAGWDVVTAVDAAAARSEMAQARPGLVVLSTATEGAGALASSCSRSGGGPGVIALVRPGGSAEALSAADTTLAEPFGDDALRSTVGQVMPAAAAPPPAAGSGGGGDSKLTSEDIFGDLVAEMATTAEALGDSLDQPPRREPRSRPSSLDDDLDSRLEQTLSGVLGPSRRKTGSTAPDGTPKKRRPKPDPSDLDVDALLSDTLDGLNLGRRRGPAPPPKKAEPEAPPEPPPATPPAAGPPAEIPAPPVARASTEVRPPEEPDARGSSPFLEPLESEDEPWDLDDDAPEISESERAEETPFAPAPRPANLDFDAALASLVPTGGTAPGDDAPKPPAGPADRESPPATSFLSSGGGPPGPPGPPATARPPAGEQPASPSPEPPQPSAPPPPEPPAAAEEEAASGKGRPFGQYRLLDRIGVGGMAEVWKARMSGVEGFQKMVAIKKILPHLTDSTDFVEMFVDEAKLAAQLNHSNIIHIYDLGKIGDDFYIAMEYVDGENLRSILNRSRDRRRPFPTGLALYLASRLASALDHAHHKKNFEGEELGLVHRDVSPQNVLVSYDGDIKLCDFGIVKAASKSSHTRMGALKGKIQYMSPEQASGKNVDRRSDVFSLGALTFEMLTGRRLFTGESEMEVLEAVRDCRVHPPSSVDPSIPADVDAVVLAALAEDPDDRFQSAGEIGRQLEEILLTYRPTPGQKELARFMESLFGDAPALAEEERIDEARDPAAAVAPALELAEAPEQPAPGEPPLPGDNPLAPAQLEDILAPAGSAAPAPSAPSAPWAEDEPGFEPPPLVLDEEPAPTPADLDILVPPPKEPPLETTRTGVTGISGTAKPADVEALEPPPGAEQLTLEEGGGRGRGLLVAAILLLVLAGALAAWYFLAGPGAPGPGEPAPVDSTDEIVAPARPQATEPSDATEATEATGPGPGAAAGSEPAEGPAADPLDPEELERMAAEALAERMAQREDELRRQFEEEERRLQRQIQEIEESEPPPP